MTSRKPERNGAYAKGSNGKQIPEYAVWNAMIARCHRPKTRNFHRYGGRGITVCRRWRFSFAKFIEDMGPRPSPRHSIERVDNEKGYTPSNCRWVTKREQSRNTSQTITVTWNGRTQCLLDWAKDLGMSYAMLRWRSSQGWSAARMFTTPNRQRSRLR